MLLADPIVIDPPNFDPEAAWKSCQEDSGRMRAIGRDIAAAAYSDPGVCSCPSCHVMHWAWGRRQRCTSCSFEYPVNWWSDFGRGRDDHGPAELPTEAPDQPENPYYMMGWRNRGMGFDDVQGIDWRPIVEAFTPWTPTPEEAESIASAPKGDCRHYRGILKETCAAGVELRSLVGGEDLGWCTRLPCIKSLRRRANGPVACCGKFDPHPEKG